MDILLVIVESVGLVVGSIVAAILLCSLLWTVFKLVHHPAWGPPIVVVPVILWAANLLPRSEFLRMTMVFAMVAAVPFWVEGRAWRTAWTAARRPDGGSPARG
jgi:hypothetical protein